MLSKWLVTYSDCAVIAQQAAHQQRPLAACIGVALGPAHVGLSQQDMKQGTCHSHCLSLTLRPGRTMFCDMGFRNWLIDTTARIMARLLGLQKSYIDFEPVLPAPIDPVVLASSRSAVDTVSASFTTMQLLELPERFTNSTALLVSFAGELDKSPAAAAVAALAKECGIAGSLRCLTK